MTNRSINRRTGLAVVVKSRRRLFVRQKNCLGLMAFNYRRFGDSTAANLALIAGLIATGLLLTIGFVLPGTFPSIALPAAYTFGMYHFVKTR